jgi:hypothetical protein
MFNALLISSIYVLDQDQALDFYVGKLGLEVNTDQDLGFMRWLTVNVPGDTRQILLETPGAPALDQKTAGQVRELVSKGATGSLRRLIAARPTTSFEPRVWSSPRSRPSDPTASTAGCAIHSATTSGSPSRCKFRRLRRVRAKPADEVSRNG